MSAVSDAIEDYQNKGRMRGASTITMQVSRNVFLWNGGVVRKALEIPLALLLDATWPKRRIIETYLNIAEWGDGAFGAEAAARRYFNKPANQLTAAEAARLAVILPNPIRWSAIRPTQYIRTRTTIVERRMRQLGSPQTRCLESGR
jgi:monofunctional biosynthetic peptidoglycan transglycosylase